MAQFPNDASVRAAAPGHHPPDPGVLASPAASTPQVAVVLRSLWGQGDRFLLWTQCFVPLIDRMCQGNHPPSSARHMSIMTLTILWTLSSILEAVARSY